MNIYEYIRTNPKIQGYISKICFDNVDRDDLIQNASVRIFRFYNDLPLEEQIKVTYPIIHSTYVDMLRSKHRKIKITNPISYYNESLERDRNLDELSRISIDFNMDSHIDTKNALEKIYNSKISFKEAAIMFAEGYTYKEIQKYYQCDINTTGARIKYGRHNIKKVLI